MSTIKNLVDLNKPTQMMYNKHIRGQQIVDYSGSSANAKFTDEQVAQIHCLSMFGVRVKDIAKVFKTPSSSVSGVKMRNFYRNVKLPYQTGRFKKLGKMWFTYDKELVMEFYNTLPDDLKGLCSELDESMLIQKTKITKAEIILV